MANHSGFSACSGRIELRSHSEFVLGDLASLSSAANDRTDFYVCFRRGMSNHIPLLLERHELGDSAGYRQIGLWRSKRPHLRAAPLWTIAQLISTPASLSQIAVTRL